MGSNDNGYYKKWSNGLIEQWGTCTSGAQKTLPVAYTTTDYAIQLMPELSSASVAGSINFNDLADLKKTDSFFVQCRWNGAGTSGYGGYFYTIGY